MQDKRNEVFNFIGEMEGLLDPKALASDALIAAADDMVAIAELHALGYPKEQPEDEGSLSKAARQRELQVFLNAYIDTVLSRLVSGDALPMTVVEQMRRKVDGSNVVTWERYREEARAALANVEEAVRSDVLRLISAEEKLQRLLREIAAPIEPILISYSPMAIFYLTEVALCRRAGSGDDLLFRCRMGCLDRAIVVNEQLRRLAESGIDPAHKARLLQVQAVACGVQHGLFEMLMPRHDGAEDVAGEEEFDEQVIIDDSVDFMMNAWNQNLPVLRPDGKFTSKIHAMSRLVRNFARTPAEEAAQLSMRVNSFLDQIIRLESGYEVSAGVELVSSWAAPLAIAYTTTRCFVEGNKDEGECQRIVREVIAEFLESFMLEMGDTTVFLTMCRRRRQQGFLGRQWAAEDLDEQKRSQVYAFCGQYALFFMDEKPTSEGITARYGSLTVWDRSWKMLGAVSGYWLEGVSAKEAALLTERQFCELAANCEGNFDGFAKSLCKQLGGFAPRWPVMIVDEVERHDMNAPAGFGATVLSEFVRQVRGREPSIVSVVIQVEPGQFLSKVWEDPLASFQSSRFEALQKVKSWCHGEAMTAMKKVGVERVIALENRVEFCDTEGDVVAQLWARE